MNLKIPNSPTNDLQLLVFNTESNDGLVYSQNTERVRTPECVGSNDDKHVVSTNTIQCQEEQLATSF